MMMGVSANGDPICKAACSHEEGLINIPADLELRVRFGTSAKPRFRIHCKYHTKMVVLTS